MRARWYMLALCVGGVALLACNENSTAPLVEPEKPQMNDVELLAPFLEFIPCERWVGVAWKLTTPVRNARVTLDVLYYEVRDSADRPGARIPNHIDDASWKLVSTQRLGKNLPQNGSCPWLVPALECDQAVVCITVERATQGNRTFERRFAVGEVRIPNSHQPPAQEID